MWKSYRHRFVPWVTANWSTRLVKRTELRASKVKEERAVEELLYVMERLSFALPSLTPLQTRQLVARPSSRLDQLVEQGREVMRNVGGFSIMVGSSKLPGAGQGVIVESGRVKAGQLVALYPGTMYLPHQPILLQSISNAFILRCTDGILVDGKNEGISRWIYKSCAFRDVIGQTMSCDLTWLGLKPINPLNIGQIVNNQTREVAANVEYQEIDVPGEWPLRVTRLFPNVFYQPHLHSWNGCQKRRVVGLLATRDILAGEELYSSYITMVLD